MSDQKIAQKLRNLGTALQRLHEALQEPDTNSLVIDGTIQRFEFVVELYWRTLKRLLAAEHIQTNTPKETLQQAYQANWFCNEDAWLQMLRDRNETSHVYNEAAARQIYEHIKEYYPEMKRVYEFLCNRFGAQDK